MINRNKATFRNGSDQPEERPEPTSRLSDPDTRGPRLYANSRPAIKGFLGNLTSNSRCSDKRQRGVPFTLALSNFRRKMIIETLQDRSKSHEDRKVILAPLGDYLRSERQQMKHE